MLSEPYIFFYLIRFCLSWSLFCLYEDCKIPASNCLKSVHFFTFPSCSCFICIKMRYFANINLHFWSSFMKQWLSSEKSTWKSASKFLLVFLFFCKGQKELSSYSLWQYLGTYPTLSYFSQSTVKTRLDLDLFKFKCN